MTYSILPSRKPLGIGVTGMGARRRVPASRAERRLSVGTRDLRRDERQRVRRADYRRSPRRVSAGKFDRPIADFLCDEHIISDVLFA